MSQTARAKRLAIAGIAGEIETEDWTVLDQFLGQFYESPSERPSRFYLRVKTSPSMPETGEGPFAYFARRESLLQMGGLRCSGVFDYQRHQGVVSELSHARLLQGFLTAIIMGYLFDDGGLVLHAAGIKTSQGAIVFSGTSGAGKTTLAERLEKEEGIEVISDEAVAIRPSNGGYSVDGLPWRGRRLSAPLLGLFHLSPGTGLNFHRLGSQALVRALWSSVYFIDGDPQQFDRFLDICPHLTSRIPCWQMEYSRTAEFWPTALELTST